MQLDHGLNGQQVVGKVSILIRPEGRMQPIDEAEPSEEWVLVSILIRPEGRMQHAGGTLALRISPGFNPHPARRPDATVTATNANGAMAACFNPHPARRPDATLRG